MKTIDRFKVVQDQQLHSKLRQIASELKEWANRAEKGKLTTRDSERMKFESAELEKLISNKEL
jgi:hypothetical protein